MTNYETAPYVSARYNPAERHNNQVRARISFDPKDKTNRAMRRAKSPFNTHSPNYYRIKSQTKNISLRQYRSITIAHFMKLENTNNYVNGK